MKLNWGSGIAAVYIIFVIAVLITVVVFMNQDVSLETKDYYAKGIAYQEQIDKMNRANELPEKLAIEQTGNYLNFSFPKIFNQHEIGGMIYFYRPSNNQKDFLVNIQTDTSGVQTIPVASIAKGLWKIKVDWSARNNTYYNEKILMVN